jgi:phage terminase large subunit GpA-like protein
MKYVINIANQCGLTMYLYSNGDTGQMWIEQGKRKQNAIDCLVLAPTDYHQMLSIPTLRT